VHEVVETGDLASVFAAVSTNLSANSQHREWSGVKIQSKRIPQADKVLEVGKVAEAVAAGAKSYQDIAEAIGKVHRQGRYYRLAAEQVGFLKPTVQNYSELTVLGMSYVKASTNAEKRATLIKGMLQNPVLRGVLKYIAGSGLVGRTRDDLRDWLRTSTTATGTTPGRRVTTVRNWLDDAGLTSTADDVTRLAPAGEEALQQAESD